MKIETKPTDDHQVKITVEFEADVFDGYKRRAAKKIAKQAKVPGFRPGKAPYNVIVNMYGEGAIVEEAVDLLIDEQYSKVLEEAAVEPGAMGAVDEISSIDPLTITFNVPLKPEVELGDYKSIRMDYEPEETTDEDVNEFLENLQKNYATAEPVEDRASQEGDMVYFKISGKDTKVEEGDPTVLEEKTAQKIIGEENGDTWPFEGFGKKLVGLKPGGKKKIKKTFKKDEGDEEFQGKSMEFAVEVDSIKEMKLPELDDEFAKTLGQFEDMESLKKVVREQIENQKNAEYEEKYYTDLLEKIAEQATVKYPPQMVEEEVENIIHNLEHDLSHQGMDFNTYLKLMGLEREAYVAENVRPAAEKRLVNSLIIESIAKEEKVEIGQEDVQSIMAESMQMMENMPKQNKKKANEMAQNVTMNAMSRLYNQKTLEHMKAIASGELEKAEEPTEESTEPETEAETVEKDQTTEAADTPDEA